jgi:hypothetical protein
VKFGSRDQDGWKTGHGWLTLGTSTRKSTCGGVDHIDQIKMAVQEDLVRTVEDDGARVEIVEEA